MGPTGDTREAVLAAVQNNGWALQHASEELRTGREWTLASNSPVAVTGTSAPTLTIRNIVRQEGDSLRLCADMMCGDKWSEVLPMKATVGELAGRLAE